ncbi:P-loop containing nucleoside triphosphate hydrolase protein, partial [Ochromonadaceae sp. CCMP2298]
MGSAESTSSDVLMPSTNDMPAWVLVVFEFSDWRTRAHLMQVSKRWRHNTSDPQFFRFLARRLSLEHAIYIPPQLPSNDTWRGFFFDMYKLRHVWTPEAASGGSGGAISTSVSASGAAESVLTAEGTEEEGVDKAEALPYESHKGAEPAGERFKISVIARFRPGVLPNQGGQGQGDGGTGGQGVVVTLPLHQRLAMIRMSRRLSSNKQALRVLTSEGGWFGSRWSQLSASSASSTPTASASAASTSGGDKENNSINNISSGISSINITPLNHHATKGGATFDADSKVPKFVREMCAERARVALRGVNTAQGVEQGTRTYNTCARRLVVDFINGFNATAIVYGQTGSGKTYSMFGLGGEQSNENGEPGNTGTAAFRENMGIVPRACEEIFAAVAARRESGVEAEVSVSYVEVFGDEVSDLMRNGARCGHSKVASQQYVLSGAAEKAVTTVTEINTLLAAGEKQKRRAATAMNERSTRAHSLFIVSLRQTRGTDVVLKSRLFLADLGGSEQ